MSEVLNSLNVCKIGGLFVDEEFGLLIHVVHFADDIDHVLIHLHRPAGWAMFLGDFVSREARNCLGDFPTALSDPVGDEAANCGFRKSKRLKIQFLSLLVFTLSLVQP